VSASDSMRHNTIMRHNTMTSNVMFLPHEPRALGLARRQVRGDLASLGLGGVLVDDVVLVVSELVGNAVQHARALPGELLELSWWLAADGVHLQVTDGGSALPVELGLADGAVSRPAHGARRGLGDSGRGLIIVGEVAARWGAAVESPDRHTVWAVIALPPVAPLLRAVR
jgi:serine/threonine-protein kinase RsbW